MSALLCACTSAESTVPNGDLESTRIAAGIALIPTAAVVRTVAPPATATSVVFPTAAPPTAEQPTEAPAQAVAAAAEHVVVSGDTLSTLAARYKTSIAALQLANDLVDQNVRAGARLKLPTARLADDENVFWFIYVVQPGDTFGGIAQRFGAGTDDLLRVNQIADAGRINAGQRLIIPVKQPRQSAALPEPTSAPAPPAPPAQAIATPEPVAQERVVTPIPIDPELILLDSTPEPVVTRSAPVARVDRSFASGVAPSAETLLQLYNEQRVLAGMPPLIFSPVLQASAQAHADECAARGNCGHVGLDGSSSRERIERVGYTGRFTGENWAWSRSAEGAFDMWFHQETDSGPHRKNILSGNYSEVGFGIAASKGGYIFIANLGG